MKKLLIVVDFQNDFVDGTLGFDKAKKLDDKIYNVINEYKKNNDDVIYTFDTHYDDYLNTIEGKKLPVKHCIKNTKGHDLYGKVSTTFSKEKDIYFEKNTFPSLDLANYLKNKEYESVLLVGLVSYICVLSNAIMVKSALPNVEIYVNSELTDGLDDNLNAACYKVLEGLHINVVR